MAAPLAGKRPITIATALGHGATPRLGVCGYYADGGTTTNLPGGQISDADRKARFRSVVTRPGTLFVMNVASGPGTAVKAVETAARDEFAHAGVTVLGYISCRDSGVKRPAADVKTDIDRWITFYSPDGIFLDEGEPGQTNADLAYYQDLAAYVRAKNPALLVGYNPGTYPHEDYYAVMDIIMVVEHPASVFLDPAQVADRDKTRKGPARSWAMVYGVTAGQVPAVLARARELGLHYLSVLDTDPNADWYQTLPPDSYMDMIARPVGGVGPAGPKGDTGATGAAGPAGPKGDTGATGPAGAAGAQGPKGDAGATGATGPAGTAGAAGATGPQGPAGPKGDTGPAGTSAAPTSSSVLSAVTLTTNYAAATWASMPAALTELKGNAASRVKVNLTGANKIRMTASVTTAGFAGAKIAIQYATDGDTQAAWAYLDGSSGPSVPIDSTGGKVSAWANVPAGAKGDVWLRVVGVGGNGTVSPVIGSVAVQIDGTATAIAGATTITTQRGAPTGTITNPVLDLDTGLLYTSGSGSSTTSLLTATQRTLDSTTGWWLDTGATQSGGKITIPANGQAIITVSVTAGQVITATTHVDSGTGAGIYIWQANGPFAQGTGPVDLTTTSWTVPSGTTSIEVRLAAGSTQAVFDSIDVTYASAGGGYTTQTLGGGGGNITRVLYNTSGSSWPARPTATTYVEWVGPVQPTGMQAGDTWTNTAA